MHLFMPSQTSESYPALLGFVKILKLYAKRSVAERERVVRSNLLDAQVAFIEGERGEHGGAGEEPWKQGAHLHIKLCWGTRCYGVGGHGLTG